MYAQKKEATEVQTIVKEGNNKKKDEGRETVHVQQGAWRKTKESKR